MLCGKSGFPYDFVLYQGKNTAELGSFEALKYGHGAAVVLTLSKRLTNSGHTLYFDNFFSSYNLFELLTYKMINAAGTIRVNRFAQPNFKTDAQMKISGRGSTDQLVSADGKVCVVKWSDNKSVFLASNFCGIGEVVAVNRFDKKLQQRVDISQPEIVKNYNFGMGGVDLCDQYIAYYRIFIKSRKWTLRVIFHFVNMAVVCSFLEYKKDCERFGVTPMKLLDFQQILGNELNAVEKRKVVGRPSLERLVLQQNRKRKSDEQRPHDFDRFDGLDHLPDHTASPSASRCKNDKCSGKTRVACIKCKVHLCLTNSKNCFLAFHTK